MPGWKRPIAIRLRFALAAVASLAAVTHAQSPGGNDQTLPVAVVALDEGNPGESPTVAGALQVTANKATIASSGTVTSGSRTAEVILPRRGTLHVCAATTVNLAVDTSPPPGGMPGLLMAMDHGAVEMSFASSPADANADVLMTPDFRIVVGSPGASEVKVRLGREGDTCIDNSGANAPYIVVTSLFDSGVYRVQPGQHIMLQNGSLHAIVDQEKEPCGCPPPTPAANGNVFPLAQSEGLEPIPPPTPALRPGQEKSAQTVPPLVYNGVKQPETPAATAPTAQPAPANPASAAEPASAKTATTPQPESNTKKKKPGAFTRIGHFFRRVFGAE